MNNLTENSNDQIDSIRDKMNELITKSLQNDTDNFEKAIELGDLAISAKSIVGHGNFKEWISSNFTKITYATVSNYMNISRNRLIFSALHITTLSDAYDHLKSIKTEKKADIKVAVDTYIASGIKCDVWTDKHDIYVKKTTEKNNDKSFIRKTKYYKEILNTILSCVDDKVIIRIANQAIQDYKEGNFKNQKADKSNIEDEVEIESLISQVS